MKTLTIHRLEIKNFKGIKTATITAEDGASVEISGANASGKTSVYDAFCWLMFGKDSNDRADFQLKPVDEDGQERHNLDTEVTATLGELNWHESGMGGGEMVLKKRFSEKWTKKRGSSRQEFTGHTTDYFIDDVPTKKGQFDQTVSEIADQQVFKLVTSPAEFNRLHWQDRRGILLDMCGDVSDTDVLQSNDDLSPLGSILGKRSIDDHRKAVKAQQKEINKELEQIPVRIDELTASLAEIPEPDVKAKARLEKELAVAKDKLDSVRNNERLSQKRIEANEIRAEIQDKKYQAKSGIDEEADRILKKIDTATAKIRELKTEKEDLAARVATATKRNKVSGEAMERLRQQWNDISQQKPETDDTCPACGQDLPADQVDAAKAKANQIKADKLAAIQAEGIELRQAHDARKLEIDEAEGRIAGVDAGVVEIERQISKLQDQMPEEPKADTGELEKKLAGIESEIEAIQNGTGIQERDIKAEIDRISKQLADIALADAAVASAKKTRDRLKELEKQEKQLAAEYEKLAEQVYLAERFVVEKVRMLEDRINSRFSMATFKLFKEQINSGIAECCETLHGGVPYNSALNNAARINTGIDICNTLADFYGFRGPIWIDNAEAVNDLAETPAQVVALRVTENPELKIEIINEREVAA